LNNKKKKNAISVLITRERVLFYQISRNGLKKKESMSYTFAPDSSIIYTDGDNRSPKSSVGPLFFFFLCRKLTLKRVPEISQLNISLQNAKNRRRRLSSYGNASAFLSYFFTSRRLGSLNVTRLLLPRNARSTYTQQHHTVHTWRLFKHRLINICLKSAIKYKYIYSVPFAFAYA